MFIELLYFIIFSLYILIYSFKGALWALWPPDEIWQDLLCEATDLAASDLGSGLDGSRAVLAAADAYATMNIGPWGAVTTDPVICR